MRTDWAIGPHDRFEPLPRLRLGGEHLRHRVDGERGALRPTGAAPADLPRGDVDLAGVDERPGPRTAGIALRPRLPGARDQDRLAAPLIGVNRLSSRFAHGLSLPCSLIELCLYTIGIHLSSRKHKPRV